MLARIFVMVLAFGSLTIGPAFAKDLRTTDAQPFCRDRSELGEMLQALLAKDLVWANALKTCILAKPNIKYVVLDKEDNGVSDKVAVAKVRMIVGTGSVVGFTFLIAD